MTGCFWTCWVITGWLKSFLQSWHMLSPVPDLGAREEGLEEKARVSMGDGFKKHCHFVNIAGLLEGLLVVCGLLYLETSSCKWHRIGRSQYAASAFTLSRPQSY